MARDYQTKANVGALPDTITATRFGAGEFNSIATELENAVSTSDQTLAPADGTGEVTDQLAMALAIYGAGGAFYHADTGAVNAYVLTPISPKESPPAYFDGFTVIFEAGTVNTTASTVNVNSLGVKDITYSDGNALVGGELSGSCGIKYNLSDDRFELLFSSGALAGLSQVYVIDASQADQGAASTNPNTYTVFDAAAAVGTTKNATLYFPHNPVAGNQTLFTFDTSLDLTSYPNLLFKIDQGAQFDRTTGDEVFTVYSPENFELTDRQVLTAVDMISFSIGGAWHPDHYLLNATPGTTDMTNAIQYACNALSGLSGSVIFLNSVYLVDSAPTLLNGKYVGVTLPGNIELKATSELGATIRIGSNVDFDALGLANESGENSTVDTYHDENIVIDGLIFEDDRTYPAWNEDTPPTYVGGYSASDLASNIVRFFSCYRPVVKNCRFYDITPLCVTFGGCYQPVFRNNVVDSCAYIYLTTYCVWAAAGPAYGYYTVEPLITGNSFINIDYSPLLVGGGCYRAIVTNNHFNGSKEAAIHAFDSLVGAVISNNHIKNVVLGDISGHGIEGENLTDAIISNNLIEDCDIDGITIVGAKRASFTNNILKNNGAATVYPLGVSSLALGINGNAITTVAKAGIKIIQTPTTNDVEDIKISDNVFYDDTAVQEYCISFGDSGGVAAWGKWIIQNNDCKNGFNTSDFYFATGANNSTDKHIKNNIVGSYITRNKGNSSIASGTGTTAVNHGLSVTPSGEDIMVIGRENPDNSVGTIFVGAFTATTFNVYVENDPGASGFDFAWSINTED